MEIREALAQNLRAYRHAKGLSQEELAHRADIDRTYISALERSVYAASIDVLDRLAKVLEIETADLLRLPPPPEGPARLIESTANRRYQKAGPARIAPGGVRRWLSRRCAWWDATR